jgi:3-phenylpropionate/cinnamic acid dioxygenase small subunit
VNQEKNMHTYSKGLSAFRWLAPLAACGALLGAPVIAAQPGMPGMQGMHVMQEVQDRATIEDLMWRYARALDSSDADGYAAVYTEGGQFGTGDQATKGRAALKKMVADLKQARIDREAKGEPKRPGTLHMVTNHSVVFKDADHATYNAYWVTMFTSLGAETPARVGAVGRSIDELVRVNGQWLIKSRNVTPQD